MKTYGDVYVQLHIFLISALVGGVTSQLHAAPALTPEQKPPVSTGEETGCPQSQSGHYEEVKILDHIGTRTQIPRSSSQ
jgi:hypothetical protein